MSLYGVLRTGVSGMAAQANRLSTVGDNVANANTTGYKRAMTEFSSLVLPSSSSSYNSGGVETNVRYAISQQGGTSYTTSPFDLALNGNGFFVVAGGGNNGPAFLQDQVGDVALTRAGSFVPDAQGYLRNAAGYYLMGTKLEDGVSPPVVQNSTVWMRKININEVTMQAIPSSHGVFSANIDARAPVGFSYPVSLTAYNNLGGNILLNLTFTKIDDNRWSVGGGDAPVEIEFNPSTGKLTAGSENGVLFKLTNPSNQDIVIDLSGMTQFESDYEPIEASVNGSAPSTVADGGIAIAEDGTVTFTMTNGSTIAGYRVVLANVPSPDNLVPRSGNVYWPGKESGDVFVGYPGEAGFAGITSNALEQSNVDIAEELATMIETQRNYSANTKTFQTADEILQELMNLKR